MLEHIKISNEDIIEQVKLSYQFPKIIEEIVIRKILENTAIETSILVEAEELQKAADQLRLANNLVSTDETLFWLEKHNLSLDEFEKTIYNTVISRKLAAHLFADKVEPYFFENQVDYTCAVLYEILLDDEDLVMELFYAIQEGEMSFYDVAHKYIQDTELRRQGGYRGIVHRKDLKPEISAAVFAAKPPQLLKPIATSSGVSLILVEEIIQPKLDEKLHNQILSNFFLEWLKQQIEQVEILQLV